MSFWTAIVTICCAGMITGVLSKILELAAAKRSNGGLSKEESRSIIYRLENVEKAIQDRDRELESLRSDLDFYQKLIDKQ